LLHWHGTPPSLMRRVSTLTATWYTCSLPVPCHTPPASNTTTTTVRSEPSSSPTPCRPRVHHHHGGWTRSHNRSKGPQISVNGSLPTTNDRLLNPLPLPPRPIKPLKLDGRIRRGRTRPKIRCHDEPKGK
jgi:hypothetical protein